MLKCSLHIYLFSIFIVNDFRPAISLKDADLESFDCTNGVKTKNKHRKLQKRHIAIIVHRRFCDMFYRELHQKDI